MDLGFGKGAGERKKSDPWRSQVVCTVNLLLGMCKVDFFYYW